MKALSRLASPAGFALVLLLFLFLPFLSVSCEVPGMGKIGADYTGAQLAVGDEPEAEVPAELTELAEELPGAGSEDGEESEPPPDPGVQVLAIITAVLMAAGIATVLISRTRTRLLGAAGVAALAGVLVVVTQLVAQSNLTGLLQENAQELAEDETSLGDVDQLAEEMIHTELGFWLSLIGLVLIALVSLAFAFRDKIFKRPPAAGAGAPPPHAGSGQPWMGGTPPVAGHPVGPAPGGPAPVPPADPSPGATAVGISPANGTTGDRTTGPGTGETMETEGPKTGDR
jgi:hypothetical protein